MTARSPTSPPPPGESCSTPSATSTRASSRATGPSSDDRHLADGYRQLATTLGVAFDTYLFAEPSRPIFIELNNAVPPRPAVGRRQHRRVLPARRGRRRTAATGSRGNKGDAIYFAITGYNEPSPGAWSDKVVLHKHDSDMDVDADGNFSFEIGPVPDIAAIVTRDYQLDAESGRRSTWQHRGPR